MSARENGDRPKGCQTLQNESMVSLVSRRYMRAEIGNENLVVCLSEYLPIYVKIGLMSFRRILHEVNETHPKLHDYASVSVFTLAFSRKRQKLPESSVGVCIAKTLRIYRIGKTPWLAACSSGKR